MEEMIKALPQHTNSWSKGKMIMYKYQDFWLWSILGSCFGILEASLERPEKILLLKYEDLKSEPKSNVKRLADFIGSPFSVDEEKAGVVDNIIKFCGFENMSKLEVNKTEKINGSLFENRFYYRKGKVGDWMNYFTNEMKEKIDKLTDEKFNGTSLLLK
ncbi:hypothetical protein R6Q57_005370 [Mikania cordata]